MKKEDAIKYLQQLYPYGGHCWLDEQRIEAISMAIKALQEEPVSEELEKAANEWDAKASFTPFYMTLDDKGNPNGVRQDYTTHAESFKAGAKWQKEQMMAKAKYGTVQKGNQAILDNGTYIDFDPSMQLKPSFVGLKEGDRIKVIVIKED